jgi:tRNA nucleotidyltransferase (CCA-adding enzyme)
MCLRLLGVKFSMLNFAPNDKVKRVVSLLCSGGASDCIFVGGCVRDHFLGLSSKDIDIEVYGLTYDKILRILRAYFNVNFVGQSFGTIKVDNEIDINIPRVESKSGVGHRGFEISFDPQLDLYSAFSRRDFTINAIGIRLDGTIYDPFGGIDDIKCKVLRAPTATFCEDPLRVLRGMQFAARFGFTMESGTVELCKRVIDEFSTLSTERVWGEWSKWGLKGVELSRGLLVLQETGWIQHFPEVAELINVTKIRGVQSNGKICSDEKVCDEKVRDESMFVNTARICDVAVKIADEFNFDEDERLVLIFAALCYNFGKTELSECGSGIGSGNGIGIGIGCSIGNGVGNDLLFQKLRGSVSNCSLGLRHPEVVSKTFCLAERFLERFKPPLRVSRCVLSVIGECLTEFFVLGIIGVDDNILRRVSVRLEPSSVKIWLALCRAVILADGDIDLIGRVNECELRAKRLGVLNSKLKPILQGRDLIQLGVNSGRAMGEILNKAYEAQLDGIFNNIDEAILWYKNLHQNKKS